MELVLFREVLDTEQLLKEFAGKMCTEIEEQRECIAFMADPIHQTDAYLSYRQKISNSIANLNNMHKTNMSKTIERVTSWQKYSLPNIYGIPMRFLCDLVYEDLNRIETDIRMMSHEANFPTYPNMQKLDTYKARLDSYARMYSERKPNPYSQYVSRRNN